MKDTMRKVLSTIFTVCLMLFMIMGIGIVLIQALCIIIGNGALSAVVAGTPKTIVLYLSVIAGFAGFIYSYIAPKKGGKK